MYRLRQGMLTVQFGDRLYRRQPENRPPSRVRGGAAKTAANDHSAPAARRKIQLAHPVWRGHFRQRAVSKLRQ